MLMGPFWSQLHNEIIIRTIYITVFCIIPFLSELLGFDWAAFFFYKIYLLYLADSAQIFTCKERPNVTA